MTRIEMVEEAMQLLGDAAADELAAFVQKKHGEKIDPRFIPVFLASIRGFKHLEASRRERTVARQVEAEAPQA